MAMLRRHAYRGQARRHGGGALGWLWLVTVTLAGGGCDVAGMLAVAVFGDTFATTKIDAEYNGLEGKQVAVMVAADEMTLYQYPRAAEQISRSITGMLNGNMKEVHVIAWERVLKYQRANPDWGITPYGQMIEALHVDRIVYVDLTEYRTHDPGNLHVGRGVVRANVGVAEAQFKNSSGFAYQQTVNAVYPSDNNIGIPEADKQSIQEGLSVALATNIVRLFHDHKVKR